MRVFQEGRRRTRLTARARSACRFYSFAEGQSRQLELVVYHTIHTWSDSAGETFVDRESGPDHYYFAQNGDLIIESTGTLRYADSQVHGRDPQPVG